MSKNRNFHKQQNPRTTEPGKSILAYFVTATETIKLKQKKLIILQVIQTEMHGVPVVEREREPRKRPGNVRVRGPTDACLDPLGLALLVEFLVAFGTDSLDSFTALGQSLLPESMRIHQQQPRSKILDACSQFSKDAVRSNPQHRRQDGFRRLQVQDVLLVKVIAAAKYARLHKQWNRPASLDQLLGHSFYINVPFIVELANGLPTKPTLVQQEDGNHVPISAVKQEIALAKEASPVRHQ